LSRANARRESIEQAELAPPSPPRLFECDAPPIEFAAPDLKRTRIVGNMSDSKACALGQNLDTAAGVEMEMAWRVDLDPVRAVLPPGPAVRDREPKEQGSAGFDEASKCCKSSDGILHVLEAVMGHHQAVAAAMVF